MKHNLRQGPNPRRFNWVPWVSLYIVDSMPWLTSKTAIDWWRYFRGKSVWRHPRPRFWSDIDESMVLKPYALKVCILLNFDWLTLLWTVYLCTNWYFHAAVFISKFSERALLQTSLYFPQSKISSYGLGMKAAKIGPDLMLSITLPFVSGKHTVLNFGHGQKAKFFFVLSLFSLLPLFLAQFFSLYWTFLGFISVGNRIVGFKTQ